MKNEYRTSGLLEKIRQRHLEAEFKKKVVKIINDKCQSGMLMQNVVPVNKKVL
jgi:hypothetical protein